MDISLQSLEEALLIRRQIGTLKKRLALLLGTALSRSAFETGRVSRNGNDGNILRFLKAQAITRQIPEARRWTSTSRYRAFLTGSRITNFPAACKVKILTDCVDASPL
jgi:hypothetical protein